MELKLSTDAQFNKWVESASLDELKFEKGLFEGWLNTLDDEELLDIIELRLETIKYMMGDFELPTDDEDDSH